MRYRRATDRDLEMDPKDGVGDTKGIVDAGFCRVHDKNREIDSNDQGGES
jgi:hypothetical protein